MRKGRLLLLTLVHPDFLPPVYSIAQVLRDTGYQIHILTFDSYITSTFNPGADITIESVGSHHNTGFAGRVKLRRKFQKTARDIAADQTEAIIAFCSFSFLCALDVKGKLPVLYVALEIANFMPDEFLRSPLSNYRNYLALKNVPKADLVATPSLQRSAWLAGRCRLSFLPYTILNAAYIPDNPKPPSADLFQKLVPPEFPGKKMILYTGAVNESTCILELVQAFELLKDEQAVLVINGLKENEYCGKVKALIGKSSSARRITTLPYLNRDELIALQFYAHIGVNLTRENQANVESMMVAPNKTGEYLSNNLYILGLKNEYLRPLELKGVASLSRSASPSDISEAMQKALAIISNDDYKAKIIDLVQNNYSMQKQLRPVIRFLSTRNLPR